MFQLAQRNAPQVLNLFEPHQQKLVHSYKIAGQPDLGNFATTACPMFMTKALVKANADLVTTFGVRGPSPLSISHFQGYSGAKSLFRNTPRDYIFKSGIWSIGLAISRPVLSKDVKAHVDARSVARDTQGIRNKHRLQLLAVESSAYKHFRFEYILNMRLDGFIDHDKNASSVFTLKTGAPLAHILTGFTMPRRTVTNFGIVPLAVAFMEALTDWKKTLCRVPSNVRLVRQDPISDPRVTVSFFTPGLSLCACGGAPTPLQPARASCLTEHQLSRRQV